jgi:uncharacterized membrane protein (DUF373 family)
LILLGLLDLGYLLWHGLSRIAVTIDSVGQLQKAMQHGFAGALLLLIGLELLETVRAYLADRHIRLEVVLVVAIIAAGRHIIMLDLDHLIGLSLFGIAALMLAGNDRLCPDTAEDFVWPAQKCGFRVRVKSRGKLR